MKIAVTGATGHVALCLIPRLIELGHQVRAVCFGDTGCLDGLDVEQVPGDVRELDSMIAALTGQEIVVHLAAHISVQARDEPLMHRVNVDGVRNTATAALQNGVRRMVHVSSVHAFDTWRLDRPLTEADPKALRPKLPAYDRTKALGEQALQELIAAGLDATILNPVGILGPHDHRPSLIGGVLCEIYRGRMPILPPGYFCWVDVRDVVEMIIHAMDQGRRGENYLLSAERVRSIDFHHIAQQMRGRRRWAVEAPLPLLRLICPIVPLFSRFSPAASSFTADALHALDARLDVDATKARAHLHFSPRPIVETVQDAIRWWLSNAQLA